ncbi:hypothetical protein [Streptomyces atroolivaceus]|uniref:hypothetical protein n=1 Tax=Streptomyces atroolivaceus TaxID=66869 RepID=UPI00378B99E8
MARIVGVHGIRQSQTSKARLTAEWSKAISRGLGSIEQPGIGSGDLELPHWTGLLARGADRLGAEDDPFGPAAPLGQEETAFVTDALEEVVHGAELATFEEIELQTLGLPRLWPARLTRLVMAYDQRYPRGGGKLFVSAMREVRFYLYEPGLAARVREQVADAFSEDTSVVVGHSLGSVIAFDLLRRSQIPPERVARVRTLVTCGSPLAIPAVRRGLGVTDGEPLKLPGDISWVNAFDPGDFITGGRGLSGTTPAIADAQVRNGVVDPHKALTYLRTAPVAHAIAGEER